jgi:V/A-type H+-transporting ATPase subunit C
VSFLTRIPKPQRIFGTVKAFTEKGRLLSKAELESLCDSRDIDEFITKLKNTNYNEALQKLQRPFDAAKVENALKDHLFNFHVSMAKIVSSKELINAYYTKYIIWNLKLILKGKILGRTYEEIAPNVNLYAEELIGRRDVIVKALVSKDLEGAISTLHASEFGMDAQNAAQLYKEKGNLQIFDIVLDHTYFNAITTAFSKVGKPMDVQPLVALDIDSYNVTSTLRGKFWGLSADQIKNLRVTPTFRVEEEVLDKMISVETIKDAINELSNTTYRYLIPSRDIDEIQAISEIEQSFEKQSYKRSVLSYTKMFSYSTMIGAIKLKQFEVKNLGTICFGVEQHLDSKNITPYLLFHEEIHK